MRKLFSNYGLLIVALIAGTFGITMFLSIIFSNQNSLSIVLDSWLSHLI